MFVMILCIAFLLPIDPFDSNLIINEQAVYLSTKYTNNVQSIMDVQTFKEQFMKSAETPDDATEEIDKSTTPCFDKKHIKFQQERLATI